ncbi:segregation and condensation protein A [Ureaplasma diversum]|uniref:Segregation and condensation protein A n=1 Tax=Ureaplasma diversum TaxID=42094 RepID=A0A0C5RL78_9BACT|nr:ScpA family protein [Ureaplasma diversum]AJQ45187.1 segregation and condensation protein A [Ureaplasma diversum]
MQEIKKSIFEYKTIDYNGPLDTLCVLIKQKRMDINNLDIVTLADQYVAYINESILNTDLDILADHLAMASYLVELKTRYLLPNQDPVDFKTIEEDRKNLIDRLIQYNSYKKVAEHLSQRFDFRSTMYDLPQQDYEPFYSDQFVYKPLPNSLNPNILKELMDKIIFEYEQRQQQIINEKEVVEYDVNLIRSSLIYYLKKQPDYTSSIIKYFLDQPSVNRNRRFLAITFLIILVLINYGNLTYQALENDYLITYNEVINNDQNTSNEIDIEDNDLIKQVQESTALLSEAVNKKLRGDSDE